MILARSADQQILFFVNHFIALVFAHFIVGGELDGQGRAGFLTETAHDAARKVDAEKGRVAAAVLILGGLQGDTVDRAGGRAQ
jgi:hypothetical protein